MVGWFLFILFVVLPASELVLLIYIGNMIGLRYTLLLILGTGLLGALLARIQGTRAWREIIAAWGAGRVPGVELAAGALFLVGAAFLLTPGVITDGVGFLFMVPFVRRLAARGLIRLFKGRAVVHVRVGGQPAGAAGASAGPPGGGAADSGHEPGADGGSGARVVRSERLPDED